MTGTGEKTQHDLSYRPYLDGVRAIAVLMVFFFHAAPTKYSGGFLGVDVFFVLSGYLITRILVEESARGSGIDLVRFYSRRVRRLTPALAALLVIVIIHELLNGSVLYFADNMRDVLWTALYSANWNLIAASDDYFGGFAEASPLRHAWSLAIEEQFYFIWPLVVWLVLKLTKKRSVVVALAVMAAAASVAIMWTLFENSSASTAYYRTDSRVHELLVGAALGAMYARRRASSHKWIGLVALPALGTLLILGGLWDAATSRYFTGGSFGIAVVAALLIVGLEEAPTSGLSRLLSTRPLVALGKISYGFYLWHWPVILWFPFDSHPLAIPLQFLISLGAATLSWLIVEQRFAARSWLARMVPAPATIVAGVAVMAIIGLTAVVVDRPSTDSAIELALADPSSSLCAGNYPPCVKVQAAPDRPVVALLGDSTAQAWLPAVEVLAEQYEWTVVQVAVGGCAIGEKLLVGSTDVSSDRQQQCFDQMPDAIASVATEYDVGLVIATSRSELNSFRSPESGDIVRSSTPEHELAFTEGIRSSIQPYLDTGAQVALLEILPDGPPIDCFETDVPCEILIADAEIEQSYNSLLRSLAADTSGVHSASMLQHVCPGRTCPLFMDGEVIRYDEVHFTGSMSRNFADELEAALDEAGIDLERLS